MEYNDKKGDERLLNRGFSMSITLTEGSVHGITIAVQYDPESRGSTVGHLEVNTTNYSSAEGTYTYPKLGDKSYGDAGWYRMQWVDAQTIILYYEGGYPVKGAAGYEVFKRP